MFGHEQDTQMHTTATSRSITSEFFQAVILTDHVPSRLTSRLPLKRADNIWEMTYRLDTRADCRMMGMLEV